MSERTCEILNVRGLHARAAAQFVQVAARFQSSVMVKKDGIVANGKSILSLISLIAGKGTTIVLEAEGPDADDALDALAELVASRFGEDE